MDSSTSQKQMNPPGPLGPADAPKLDSRHRFKLLEDCRELVLEKLSGVITKALEKMADELTVEALKATRSDRQRALLDAVMLVREQRKSLEQNFRRYFGDIFERRLFANPDSYSAKAAEVPLDELSLVSDQVISDKIDVDRLIQRARSRLDPNEVLGIRARLGALLGDEGVEAALGVVLDRLHRAAAVEQEVEIREVGVGHGVPLSLRWVAGRGSASALVARAGRCRRGADPPRGRSAHARRRPR